MDKTRPPRGVVAAPAATAAATIAAAASTTVTFTAFVALACATSATAIASVPRDWAIATTSYGAIRGRPMLSLNGRIFVAFLGVPYARPPLGDLRFRAPRPPLPWQGVRDARSHPPVCPQISSAPGDVIGNEDCLYLNVYARHVGDSENAATPNPAEGMMQRGGGSVPLPVLMWLHGGGGFATGGASAGNGGLGPELIMDRELLLVVPQFRLGPLGFFSSNDALAPGNYGLKDLVLALRWIRANAPVFGGDPERITVGGSGSGAALAHLLALAPSSRGMIRSVACIGGSALSPWAFQHDPRPSARALATVVGCLVPPSTTKGDRAGGSPLDEKVLKCLRRTTAATLVVAASKFSHWSAVGVGPASSFAPVVERAPTQRPMHGAWLEARFLAEPPERLIRSRAQPPTLFAATTGTATLLPPQMLRQPLRAEAAQRRATLRDLRDALQRMVVRGVMPRGGGAALTTSATALQRALSHYGGSLGNGDPRPLVNALADGWLGHTASVAARRAAPFSANPVYFVMMDLGPADIIKKGGDEGQTDDVPRTSNDLAEFLEKVQPKPGPPVRASSGAWRAARTLAVILETLATHGHPAPARWASASEWRPLSRAGRFRLLLAARDGVRAQDAPHALLSRLVFWDDQAISAQRLVAATAAPQAKKLRPGQAMRVRREKVSDRARVSKAKRIQTPIEEATKKSELAAPSKLLSTSVEIIKGRLQQLEKAIWSELKNLQIALHVMDHKGSLQLLPEAVRRVQAKLKRKRPQTLTPIHPPQMQQKTQTEPSLTVKQKTSAKRLNSQRDISVAMDSVTRNIMDRKHDIDPANIDQDITKRKRIKSREYAGKSLLSTHTKSIPDYDTGDNFI